MSKNACENCGQDIKTMSFRGTGVCSENCRKAILHEKPIPATDPTLTAILKEQNLGTIRPDTIR